MWFVVTSRFTQSEAECETAGHEPRVWIEGLKVPNASEENTHKHKKLDHGRLAQHDDKKCRQRQENEKKGMKTDQNMVYMGTFISIPFISLPFSPTSPLDQRYSSPTSPTQRPRT